MTNPERAQQLWSLLVLAARNQQVLSYEMIGRMTGMAQDGLGGPLGFIFWYCRDHDLPLLNVLAISKKKGMPTFGGDSWGELKDMNLSAERARVFVFDWLEHGAPTAEELEQSRGTKAS